VWELAYAPALGHPARLSGRTEVTRHVIFLAVGAPCRFDKSLCPDLGNCRLRISKGIYLEIEKAKVFHCIEEPSFAQQAARSCSCANISILRARPRRSIRRSSIWSLGKRRVQ
jgi:hypothetical protein